MAENLSSLSIACIDELACVLALRRFLEMAAEQLDTLEDPPGEAEERVGLLIDAYLSQTEPHFDELQFNLEKMKQLLVKPDQGTETGK